MSDKILLGHGSGGLLMHSLIERYLVPAFGLRELMDSAVVEGQEGRLALTTDSYVVSPLFFPGGDIGELSVNGTVNDLSMVGARPLYLTAGFIIEEGFPMDDLERVISSMARAAERAGVKVVAGDTKVVDRGKGDGIFINTSGVGLVPQGVELSPTKIAPGDKVIVSGQSGNHGVAIMAERNGLTFSPPVLSDTAPLNGLAEALLEKPGAVKVMRDPTRGGIATTLKEFALASGLCITIDDAAVPVAPGVLGACALLGLDHLYVANEGVLLAVVRADMSQYLLDKMKLHPLGKDASIIGEVSTGPAGRVLLKTDVGGTRMLEMLEGEQLPRIC